MAQYSGTYQHYEGTDTQCSGVQLQREWTWATDIGSSGAIRVLDCNDGVHYIYPGIDISGLWIAHSATEIKPESSKITYHPSGLLIPYDQAASFADGSAKIYRSFSDEQLYISGYQGINIVTAGDDVNIKAQFDLLASGRSAVDVVAGNDTGDLNITQLSNDPIYITNENGYILISGNTGFTQIGTHGYGGGSAVTIRSDNGDIDIIAPFDDINISGSNVLIETFSGNITMRAPSMYLFDLPRTDPSISGQMWDNSGVINISQGP
jgi:hypothetical protein